MFSVFQAEGVISVRYRHRPVAAAKRDEKIVVIDLCIRFAFDPKKRNVGLGVDLPLLLQTQGCLPSFRRAQNRAEIEMLPEIGISR